MADIGATGALLTGAGATEEAFRCDIAGAAASGCGGLSFSLRGFMAFWLVISGVDDRLYPKTPEMAAAMEPRPIPGPWPLGRAASSNLRRFNSRSAFGGDSVSVSSLNRLFPFAAAVSWAMAMVVALLMVFVAAWTWLIG